jgi:predicted dehydrogenase
MTGTHIGIIGCGFIADTYIRSIKTYPSLKIAGVTDRNMDRANRFGAFHGLPVFNSVEQLLSDPKTGLVLNLTNPRSHYEVSKVCLEAGKHVYSEKPLAMELEQAKELVDLAAARGLQISSAPCNLLGECAQTMWKAVRENCVGRVRAVYAEMDDGLVHLMPYQKWLSESGTPWPFKDEFETGCTMEHAGYCLSWLVAFFGPAQRLTAFSSLQIPGKHPSVSPVGMAPDFSVATIQLASGVVARLTCSLIAPVDHDFKIFGDEGVLYSPDVWEYGTRVYSRRYVKIRRKMFLNPLRTRHRRIAEPGRPLLQDDRGRGVAELVSAIAEGRQSRLSPNFSLHVTELTLAIHNAGTNGGSYQMTTTFDPVEPMPWAL